MQLRKGRMIGWLVAAAATGCLMGSARADGHAETYAIADALFLQRNNAAGAAPLVVSNATDAPAITAGQAQFAVQPGLRLFYGSIDDCNRGWEAGYLGVWGMFADAATAGASLRAPAPFASLPQAIGFNNRTAARSTYSSTLHSAELNSVWRSCDGGFDRNAAYPWQRCETYCHGSFDWLLGFRWAGLSEAAQLSYAGNALPGPVPPASTYSVRSTTNLFGVQVGRRGRWEWDGWVAEGWAKAALMGSGMSQSQDPIENVYSGQLIRTAHSSREGSAGFIGDINLSLTRRLSETWGLRAGYNLIWLSGVALAPGQFDFSATPASGTDVAGGFGLFLHGANLGLEARW